MLDALTLPMIAIAGGCLLLVLVVGIFWFATRELACRRRARRDARRTSFHAVAIDPRIAELGRAAFEDQGVIEVVEIEPARQPHPRRLARGSTPALATAPRAHAEDDTAWDVTPSVTARMWAARAR